MQRTGCSPSIPAFSEQTGNQGIKTTSPPKQEEINKNKEMGWEEKEKRAQSQSEGMKGELTDHRREKGWAWD